MKPENSSELINTDVTPPAFMPFRVQNVGEQVSIEIQQSNEVSSDTPNQPIYNELSLMDIEPPMIPISDWNLGIEWGLWTLLLLLIIGFVVKYRHRLYRPAFLRWQLSHLAPKNSANDFVPFEQVWLLYGWCLQLRKTVAKSATKPDQNIALLAIDDLLEKINQLGFSKQPVPREAFLTELNHAKEVLKQSCGFRPFIRHLSSVFTAQKRGSNQCN